MRGRVTGGTEDGHQVATAQEPVGRAWRLEEIAETVLWLCLDLAAFTAGFNAVVAGGRMT